MKKSITSVRNENIELQWTAVGLRVTLSVQEPMQDRWVIQLPREPLEQASRRLIEHLQRDSLKLAALGEQGAEAISNLLSCMPYSNEGDYQGTLSTIVSRSECTCGQMDCNHIREALQAAEGSWRGASVVDRLAWIGWTADTLLNTVLDRWASKPPIKDAESELKRFIAHLDTPAYRNKEGEANLAEWMAEMAHNGRLHQPGPELHDVEISLSPMQLSPQDTAVHLWNQLLPGVPGVAEGLSLVIEQASKNAEQLAKSLRARKS
ncbi:MAG TPA: hypothetical protein VGN02_13285 [Paenibacillus sp.]